DAHLAAALRRVVLVLLEIAEIAHDLIELARVEALRGARGGALPADVERDGRAGARRELAREAIVDDARPDDGAGGDRTEVVLDRPRDHAVRAIEDQRVVADVAVERVGHDRVAAELEVLHAGGLVVAEV